MDQTTGQIETHIRNTREDLKSNLNELENKVKSVTDWRQHYAKNPGIMMAVALGGGLLLSLMVGGQRKRARRSASTDGGYNPVSSHSSVNIQGEIQKNLHEIKGALIGVGATQVKGFMSKLIPGFEKHLPPPDRDGGRSAGDSIPSERAH